MPELDSSIVEGLAGEFAERLRTGETPSIEEYAVAHPELADEIRELFPSVQMIEQLASRREQQRVSRRSSKASCPDPEQLGDYRILRRLGQGGMGIVYEAVHQTLDRRVAVKMLPPQMASSPRHVERFVRESRAAARLHHTNIVPVFGVGEDGGTYFYVMQFIDGVGLDSVGNVSNSRLLSNDYFRHVADIGVNVARALQYAHDHDVLHRDVKPANILIDDKGDVWVTDFGLAKLTDTASITASGDVLGTLRYLPPESFRGETDARSDIYGLGLTLYELLALRPAFQEESRSSLLRRIMDEEPPQLRTLTANIPRDLETIVTKAISKDAGARYPSTGELADDLQRVLDDRPIHAHRASPFERLARWSCRNPLLATLSTTSVILLLAVALLSTFGYVQLRWAYGRVDEALGAALQSESDAIAARKQAERERDRTRAEYKRAETNLGVAMRAFEEISTKLASRELPQSIQLRAEDQPAVVLAAGLSTQDAELVESLLKFYDEFASNNAAGGVVDFATARIYRRIGDICMRLGLYQKAEAAHAQALKITDRLQDTALSMDEQLLFRVRTLNSLGTARFRNGELQRVSEAHEQAHEQLRSAEPEFATGRALRYELALTLNHLVITRTAQFVHQQSRRGPRRPGTASPSLTPPAIQDEFQQAVALLEQLVRDDPQNTDYRLTLSRCHRSILPVAWANQDHDLAELAKQESIEILERLTDENPENPMFRFESADTLAMTPYVDSQTVLTDADVGGLRRSIEITETLHDQFPTALEYTVLLANSHRKMGSHLLATKTWKDAQQQLAKANELLASLVASSPTNGLVQLSLARTRWELGECLRRQGALPQSRKVLEEAITDYRAFRQSRAGRRASVGLLVGLYRELARTLEQLGERRSAAQASHKADQLRNPKR